MWISVKERLPEPWTQVLTYRLQNDNNWELRMRLSYVTTTGDWRCAVGDNPIEVTHWHLLPEPPEEEE